MRASVLITEGDAAGEIETAQQQVLATVQRTCRGDAKAASDDPVGADLAAQGAETLLGQIVHRAIVLATRGEQPLLALEDHGEVGRKCAPRRAFLGGADPKDQP